MAEYHHPITRIILYLLLLPLGSLGRTTDSPPSSTCQDNGCSSNYDDEARCVYVRNGNWSQIGREYDLTTPNNQHLCRSQNDPDNCCRCFIIRETSTTTTTTTTPTTTTTTTTSTTTPTTTSTTTPPPGCTDVHGYCRASFNGSGSCIDVRQGDLTFIDIDTEPIDGKCGAGPDKCCECFKLKTEERLFVACDNYAEVFLDGVQFTDSAMSEWDETSEISVPSNTKVIAISCENKGGHYGIKASTSYGIVTDATWRCTNVHEDNWFYTDFDDSTWEFAKTDNLYVHTESWPQISENSQWIWSQSGTNRAYCRKSIAQGTVMLRRLHGTANPQDYFAKTFAEYKTGFSSNGEIWLGLDKLHTLTTGGSYGLRVKMKDWNNKEYTAVYSSFKVGPGDGYVLSISGFDSKSSTLRDSMAMHNGMMFSAKDKDQDAHTRASCSNAYSNAGWWFQACHNVLPTGMNSDMRMNGPQYIVWLDAGDRGRAWINFKEAEFLIVPN